MGRFNPHGLADTSQNHVAGGDPQTVAAARAVMEQGGNAFDGIVAGAFMAMISESALTSAGGGGYLMASAADAEPVLFDFFNTMPGGDVARHDLDFLSVSVDFGSAKQEFHIGRGSAAVPGNVPGLLRVQEKLGCLDRVTVLAPAIRGAREGVAFSAQQAEFIRMLEPILTHSPEARALYAPKGNLPREGEPFMMPEFADCLEALGEQGPALFQTGAVSETILEWAEQGGLIRAEDLAQYQVAERAPLRVEFQDCEFLLNPPPATGGVLIAHTLTQPDISTAQGLAHAMQSTAEARRQLIDPPSRGSTTHLSVLDAVGNAASLTMTNGEGCGSLLPACGFMLNNVLGEEDLNPGGFHRHAPGQRLPSMMSPTIALREGSPVLVTGTGGSNRIRSVIIQVLINFLGKGMTLEVATLSPRLHFDGETLQVEPGFADNKMDALRAIAPINAWGSRSLYFGGAHSVTPDGGFGDPRGSGCAVSF